MKRVEDAGTDIALIGAWDASLNDVALSKEQQSKLEELAEKESLLGNLFFIKTHSDGGGPIDVYIDEEVPEIVKNATDETDGEFLLKVPSGKLHIDGLEYYRKAGLDKALIERNTITVPKEDYSLKCYVGKDEDEYQDNRSEKELNKLVGENEVRYFDNMNKNILLIGCGFPILLFFSLFFLTNWMIAIPSAIIGFLLYFHVTGWFLKCNKRYCELNKIIPQFRREHERPTFVFELKTVHDKADCLKGGYIEL